MKLLTLFTAFSLLFIECAYANFHTVGWVNTIVPGGGRLVMGEYFEAGKEAALEIGTFGLGYSMSPYSSITLDGTPIDYPSIGEYTFTSRERYCSKYDPTGNTCLHHRHRTTNITDYSEKDSSKSLTAALLQEFGLKYHLMNTFFSYRDQYNIEGGDAGQGIDQRSAKEMFKDPFRWEILSSPWVYLPVALTSAFVYFDYHAQRNQTQEQITPLNSRSKAYLAFDQMVMYPVGSAAPEETFYRGFIQNEFYYMVRSPYFSVPMSSLVFALSHAQDDWTGAFLSGLYQGMLAYKNDGNLAYGNAVHFWGVVVLGVEAYVLTLKSQAHAPPAALKFSFIY